MSRTQYRTLLICLAVIINCVTLHAQATLSGFLGTAGKDQNLQRYTEQIGYLDTRPYRLSPLQKLEFRTASNQLDPQRQGYALRANPANPWEMSSNNNYFKEYREALVLKKEDVLREVLIARYDDAVQLIYFNALKDLRLQDKKLVEAQVAILEKQKNSGYFDAGDFVDLTLDQLDKSVDLEETDLQRTLLVQRMAALYPGMADRDATWNFEEIISVAGIERVIDSLNNQAMVSPLLAYREKQIALADKEYKLEKANINIGYIQAQYQHYRIEQDRKPWTISLGVTIPIVNPNKGDMTKRKLEGIEAQHDYLQAKADVQTARDIAYAQTKDLIRRSQQLDERINALRNGSLPGTLMQIREDNPTAIIRFNSNLLKLSGLQLKLKQSLLLSYVAFLGHTGALNHFPLTNYFSPRLEVIEN